LGTRGLRSIIEDLILDTMFSLPSKRKATTLKVRKKMVEKNELSFHSLKQVA